MTFVRTWTHRTYAWFTQSKRASLKRDFSARQSWPAAIIFYHRVANDRPNPWTLSTAAFDAQLELFSRLGRLASLEEIQSEQRLGRREGLKIGITFDDGYRDNLGHAIPELVSRKIPVTYFVTTGNVERQQPFAHDLRRGEPLATHTQAEIRRLAEMGVAIGGHTHTHLDLGRPWPQARLVREISDARKKLQDWSGQAVPFFAFPYGFPSNMSQAAIDTVADAGYTGFVSAFGGWNFPGGDFFHLVRFHGDPCLAAVEDWLTFDPRKLDLHRRFVYNQPQRSLPPMSGIGGLGLAAVSLEPSSTIDVCS
jgi:peptidoglycan/xylan/chitin deacetylase (PgdA/CDA1 family)